VSTKVLLDRSIFHGKNFSKLVNSRFKLLCQGGFLAFYPTPVLIEETLGLALKKGKKEELKSHLRYILDVKSQRWFRDIFELFKLELEGASKKDYLFLSRKEEADLRQNIELEIEEGDLSFATEKELLKEIDDIFKRKTTLRKTGIKIREEISPKLKELGTNGKYPGGFEAFYRKQTDDTGKEMIEKLIATTLDKNTVIKKWQDNKKRYPYFTQFVKGYLYIHYYAMSKPSMRIDINAQMDIHQLVYLKGLDMLVSNEQKFMKSAFDELYGKQKMYFSLDKLLEFINRRFK